MKWVILAIIAFGLFFLMAMCKAAGRGRIIDEMDKGGKQ